MGRGERREKENGGVGRRGGEGRTGAGEVGERRGWSEGRQGGRREREGVE